MEEKSVQELREILSSMGLKKSGTKSELIARIESVGKANSPLRPEEVDYRPTIVAMLNYHLQENVRKKDTYRARAYSNAISTLSGKKKIVSINDVKGLPGIGKGILEKIEKIISGEDTTNYFPPEVELEKVFGIGPVKSRELVNLGITTVEELMHFPELLNETQRKGLVYYHDFQLRIPRSEMDQHNDILTSHFKAMMSQDFPQYRGDITIAGSYRRGLESSGDIDVLISVDSDDEDVFSSFIERVKNSDYLIDTFSEGKKVLGVCRIGDLPFRRIDLLFTERSVFPFALMYFTGSATFNVQMREKVIALGYSLTEYGIKREGRYIPVPVKEEKDIFEFFGFNYIPPEDRVDGSKL